jgi:hypothetical protein
MKVKDLVEMLLKLNQEAEIGDPPENMTQTKTISFYDNKGWVEERTKKRYCFCGAESNYEEAGFDLCDEHIEDV